MSRLQTSCTHVLYGGLGLLALRQYFNDEYWKESPPELGYVAHDAAVQVENARDLADVALRKGDNVVINYGSVDTPSLA